MCAPRYQKIMHSFIWLLDYSLRIRDCDENMVLSLLRERGRKEREREREEKKHIIYYVNLDKVINPVRENFA